MFCKKHLFSAWARWDRWPAGVLSCNSPSLVDALWLVRVLKNMCTMIVDSLRLRLKLGIVDEDALARLEETEGQD